jgi:hypothetical protein
VMRQAAAEISEKLGYSGAGATDRLG